MSDSDTPKRHQFEAAYRGIASIALGGVALLLVLPGIQVRDWFRSEDYGPYGRARVDFTVLLLGTMLANAVIVAMSAFGIAEGIHSWKVSRRTGEPRVLSHVGVIFSVLAFVTWLLVGCGLISWGQRLLR
jgi:hypothetical protein